MTTELKSTPSLAEALAGAKTNRGHTLAELSEVQAVMVVLLRHAGCTFCREAAADIARQRAEIEAAGTKIVLVHLGDDAQAAAMFAQYGLGDVDRIADPGGMLYRAFELRRGSFWQVIGPAVWWPGLRAAIFDRHGFGGIKGDPMQMPGVFVIRHGKIVRGYRHRTSADRPDYAELACSTGPTAH
jgi:peroxiredoxin